MDDKNKTELDMSEWLKNYLDIKDNINNDDVLYFYEDELDKIDFDEYNDEYFKE